MEPSTARITEIDISRPARALMVLRWSDYTLVVVGGFGALGMAVKAVPAVGTGPWAEVVMMAAMAAVLGFAAYTGWRHVGVIDPQVWHSYLWVFALLAGMSVFGAVVMVSTWIAEGVNPFPGDLGSVLSLGVYINFAAVAVPGFVCVLLLRRMRIAPIGVRLSNLLGDVNDRAGQSAAHLTGVRRVNTARGLAYGILGLAIVVGALFVPVSLEGSQGTNVLRVIQQVTILGFFLLIRARRYFQVSADSLLAVDKRPPILFLRSFADDERHRYASSQHALLDFSLETRLAAHFYRFGPFIAIGSPKETVPQPGAARVLLSDDQWQPRVLDWMKSAGVIIMYSGTTQWVNWELRQVVESGRATSLILMFPEIKGWRASRRRQAVEARVAQIRAVFRDTPWSEELAAFGDFAGLHAMLFRADGSMLMIKSRSRSRDAYHLAALIAHQQLLNPDFDADTAAARVTVPARRLKRIAVMLAGAAVGLAVLYVIGSDDRHRLAFQQGELYYGDPFTQAEAQRVGEYLLKQQIFNDQRTATVELAEEQGRYQLRFVVDPALVGSTLATIEFGLMGTDVGRDILGGKAIDVVLRDRNLKFLKEVPSSARLEFGKSELYYTHPVTGDEARAVGEQLVRIGFFADGTAASVHLSREEGTHQLRFIVDPSRANDARAVAAFKEIAGVIAEQALGAQPVVVHLCDGEFETLRRERVERPSAIAGRRPRGLAESLRIT